MVEFGLLGTMRGLTGSSGASLLLIIHCLSFSLSL